MRYSVSLIAFLLVACSGGGGGTVADSPALPDSSNTAPSLSISASALSVDERQSLQIDASATSDPDGDQLTYDLSLNGSAFASVSALAEGPVWTLDTTQVDADEAITATITVSDGTNEVADEISFTVRAFDRTPLSTVWAPTTAAYQVSDNGSAKLSENRFYDGYLILHVLTKSPANTLSVLEFSFFNSLFRDPIEIALNLPASSRDTLLADRTSYATTRPGFAVFSTETNSLNTYKRENQDTVSDGGQLSIPGLCSAGWADITVDPDSITESASLVAGSDSALWAFLNDGAEISTRALSGTFSMSTVLFPTGDFCHPGPRGIYYNPSTRELNAYPVDGISISELPLPAFVSVPLGLSLVDIGSGQAQNRAEFIAMLFAGDAHDDAHQLSILYQASTGLLEQLDIPLPAGVPTSMLVESFDTDHDEVDFGISANLDDDIIIAVPDTPYVYVIRSEYSAEAGLSFAPIEYLETGFDVQEASLFYTDGTERLSLITNDGWTLRLFENTL